MAIVEIRTDDGVLLAARPGRLPAIIARVGDRQSLQARLRRLTADRWALDQVRRQWRGLGMSISSTALDDDQFATLLRRKVSAGQLDAVYLRDVPPPPPPVIEAPVQSGVLHVPLPGMTLLIAGKGQLPGEFRNQVDNPKALEALGQVKQGSPAAQTIDRQAPRLPGGTVKNTTGAPLVQHIAFQLGNGAHEAAVLTTPTAMAQAAARKDAPRSIMSMSASEKVGEALSRSLNYLSGDLLAAVKAMFTWEGLAIMAGFLVIAVLAPELVIPLAWIVAGYTGVVGAGQAIGATVSAMMADSDAELEAAAKSYSEAFVLMGAALLQAIMLKAAPKGGAASSAEEGAAGKGGRSSEAGQRTGGRSQSSAEAAEESAAKKAKQETAEKTAAEIAAQRRAVARKFYEDSGMDPKKIDSHLDGIDFSKPVEVVTIEPGTKLVQYKYPDRPVGNYFCPEGTPPDVLGIDPAGRVPVEFTATERITILKSTASDMKDWNGGDALFKGGGTQYFVPQKSTMQGVPTP